MYAVIQLNGKQYKVSPQDEVIVDRVEYKEGEEVSHADVLLIGDGETITVGTPIIKGASVVFTVKTHQRGEKIRVAKYKSKSRYRRVNGHRQEQSVLSINSIKI